MSRIIAGVYEIQERIGAGGGGVVYLGRHLRLDKPIVLKADKRKLSTKTEALRREVDMLKGLNHTYIPQVYDFIQEDGVVYTVMDFIEGESLDKLLLRGERPSQPEVIHWACQVLDALCYLHSRPPHGILHGDIKPANIMLRPDGDICLIDYNIALALGEDGAVKVGRSRGYASPEHYGLDYTLKGLESSGKNLRIPLSDFDGDSGETETMTEDDPSFATQTMGEERLSQVKKGGSCSSTGENSSSSNRRSVLLDVRSDIYSLGATLYHLLSGQRPPLDTFEVKSLGTDICSPAVAGILKKAMDPNPDRRYQSAEEMRRAFLRLYKDDPRSIRLRRCKTAAGFILTVLFLAGGACTFAGLKQMEQRQSALTLAEYSANALAAGNRSEAVKLALEAIPDGNNFLDAPVTAQARKALTDALGVYDLSDGFKTSDTLELPSAPFGLAISPDGGYVAAVYQGEAAVFETETGRKIAVLPIQNSALSEVLFVDESKLIIAGDQGVTVYDLPEQKILWTGEKATTLALSGDGALAASVDRDAETAVLYQVSDGTMLAECDFGGRHMQVASNDIFANPGERIFSLSQDGSLLAVSFSDGSLQIFNWKDPEKDLILYDESEHRQFEGGFCGKYFAFAANKSDESIFGLIDTQEAVYVGGLESRNPFLVKADESGIYVANGNLLVRLDPETLNETELAYTDPDHITGFAVNDGCTLVSTENNKFSFYDSGANLISGDHCQENCDFLVFSGKHAAVANRNEPSLRLIVQISHEEAQILTYDARYEHDEARLGPDQTTVMLFDYQNYRISDKEGKIIAEGKFPDAEQIYDQQFIRENDQSYLKVIWYDGTIRCYSSIDGSVINEQTAEAPSKDLYEEFLTDRYRFTSSLHGTPEAYDRKTGRFVTVLEKDSYLTYVTQVGEYIITEYISAEGERYGLMLNDALETIAYLPDLCDIADETLIFDYKSGNLRQCRLYSLQELITLGEENRQEGEQ